MCAASLAATEITAAAVRLFVARLAGASVWRGGAPRGSAPPLVLTSDHARGRFKRTEVFDEDHGSCAIVVAVEPAAGCAASASLSRAKRDPKHVESSIVSSDLQDSVHMHEDDAPLFCTSAPS